MRLYILKSATHSAEAKTSLSKSSMGRKGGGGGTAGGGRSGKRSNVTFNRVVPKFLQNLQAQRAKENVSAKSTNEVGQGISFRQEPTPKSRREECDMDVVGTLEREGFKVVQISSENDARSDKSVVDEVSNKKNPSFERTKASPRLSALKSGIVHGGIRKNTARVERPARSFKINNKSLLSFVNSDVDSDDRD